MKFIYNINLIFVTLIDANARKFIYKVRKEIIVTFNIPIIVTKAQKYKRQHKRNTKKLYIFVLNRLSGFH